MAISYQKITSELISDLDSRTKDILMKRFGLQEKEPLTLERIGQDHNITRERVRQIVDDALFSLREQIQEAKVRAVLSVFEKFQKALEGEGHLKKEDAFVENLGGEDQANHVIFLLHLGDQFMRHKETDDTHPFWSSHEEVHDKAAKLLKDLHEYLQEKENAADLHELKEVYEDPESPMFASLLEISKHVVRSLDGKYGLKHWPHVYPKTIRDKAYIALKDKGKPLHFKEVAKAIDEIQERLDLEHKKKILPQTVHNELIKDPRFVLVGRGKYGLQEWGYKEGTVKDVISSIMKQERKALTSEQILKKTLQQRHVKESTVLLNLQDRKMFAKDERGRYYLK